MTTPASAPASSKTGPMLRVAAVILLGISGLLLVKLTPLGDLMAEERIVAMADQLRATPWTPALLFIAYLVIGPFGVPVSPLVITGGVVFGPWIGAAFNSLGLIGNAMVTFWVGRKLGREAVTRLAGPKLRRAEAIFERRGFWPLIQSRFLPIPAPVVAYGAALAGVSPSRYLVTSALGLTPACVVHTYYAPALILAVLAGEDPVVLFIQYAGILFLFNVVAAWPQIRSSLRRRKRYAELMEARRQRNLNT